MDEEQLRTCLRMIEEHFGLEEIASPADLADKLDALGKKAMAEQNAALDKRLREAMELKHLDRKRQATSEDKKKYLLHLIDQYLKGYPDMSLTQARQYANKAMADYFKCKPYEEITLRKIRPE